VVEGDDPAGGDVDAGDDANVVAGSESKRSAIDAHDPCFFPRKKQQRRRPEQRRQAGRSKALPEKILAGIALVTHPHKKEPRPKNAHSE
jgi:hypothetical protein